MTNIFGALSTSTITGSKLDLSAFSSDSLVVRHIMLISSPSEVVTVGLYLTLSFCVTAPVSCFCNDIGNENMKALPTPISLSTHNRPPRCSMISLQIGNPKPVP